MSASLWAINPGSHAALDDLFEDLKTWARLLIEQDEALGVSRRSLAMAPSLPRGEVERLLDEVELLGRRRRELAAEQDALVEQVRRLRSALESG